MADETIINNEAPAENEGNNSGERMFTQTEVNEIVKRRLERAKTGPREPSEAEKRETAVTARENRMDCREYLADNNLPRELLDVIDTSDPNEFKRKAETVVSVLGGGQARRVAPLFSSESAGPGKPDFGKTPHKPRQYP